MARPDRLPSARQVAQIAAVIGREFSHELLAAVADRPQEQLEAALEQLVSSELVFRRGTPPATTYFKHALVQDAAYQSLLKSKRSSCMRSLSKCSKSASMTHRPRSARHCTEAGLNDKAAMYWYEAGQWAIRRSAYTEALAHLNAGLKVLDGPNEHATRPAGTRLRLTRAEALQATRGYIAPETIAAYNDARLGKEVGDLADIFRRSEADTLLTRNRATTALRFR